MDNPTQPPTSAPVRPDFPEADWHLVTNMQKIDEYYQRGIEQGSLTPAETGDCGAYYAAVHNLEEAEALLSTHNLIGGAADVYASALFDDKRPVHSVLDVGCGAGFVTAALRRRFPSARVVGVDLAELAIQFAKQRFPDCQFHQCGIDENFRLDGKFDVIHAREFYPFTRTTDYNHMVSILEVLLKHLNEHGRLVVANSIDPDKRHLALYSHLEKLRVDPKLAGYAIKKERGIRVRLAEKIGINLVSRVTSAAIDLFRGGRMGILVFSKK